VDKRDLAENNKFFCDRCDRGFKTVEKYNEHTAQHEKVCGYADVYVYVRVCGKTLFSAKFAQNNELTK